MGCLQSVICILRHAPQTALHHRREHIVPTHNDCAGIDGLSIHRLVSYNARANENGGGDRWTGD